jgi:hypothetical protein
LCYVDSGVSAPFFAFEAHVGPEWWLWGGVKRNMPELELILPYSIARYPVESIPIPFPDNAAERTIRVVGEKLSFQKLIDALGEAFGKKYDCEHLDPAEAKRKGLEAKEEGDDRREMVWCETSGSKWLWSCRWWSG